MSENKMKTIYRTVDQENIENSVLGEAAMILRSGELVAFPTETVYGLGANALDAGAAAKIYAAKGRPSDNPLIVHVCNMDQVKRVVREIPETAKKLMSAFWPGPLTIVFWKSEIVPKETTGGLDTVAVRMPDHKVALKLMEVSDLVIAAPSANTSGRPSPTTASHVREDMDGRIAMIIDGGEVGIGIESTIVDVTGDIPVILRPGYISKQMLEQVVGRVEIDPAILGPMKEGVHPKAPGMKYRHYAPKADFVIYEGNEEHVAEQINRLAAEYIQKGFRVGIIASDETIHRYHQGEVYSIGSRHDELSISKRLYALLREFDEKQVNYILGESFESEDLGFAIMNRMMKAAGYHVVKV